MELYNTTYTEVPTSQALQQTASGRSLIWGLIAIVLNAMLQPSFTGYLWSHDVFQDSLWPHRCSPVICALDCAAELWILVKGRRKKDHGQERPELANSTAVTMRLAIFVLGVLPQAIKLFSMRGILPIQIVAAVFLLASVVSMLRTLLFRETQSDVAALADTVRDLAAQAGDGTRSAFLELALMSSGLLVHFAFICCVWYHMAYNITVKFTNDVATLSRWVSAAFAMIGFAYLLQFTLAFMVLGRRIMPSAPMCMIMLNVAVVYDNICANLEVEKSCVRRCRPKGFWLCLMAMALLLSWATAFCLQWLASRVLCWSKKDDASCNEEQPATRLLGPNQQAQQSAHNQLAADVEAGHRPNDRTGSNIAVNFAQAQDTYDAEAPPPYQSHEADGTELSELPAYSLQDEPSRVVVDGGSGIGTLTENTHRFEEPVQTISNGTNEREGVSDADPFGFSDSSLKGRIKAALLVVALVVGLLFWLLPTLLLGYIVERAGVLPPKNNVTEATEEGRMTTAVQSQVEGSDPGQADRHKAQQSSTSIKGKAKAALSNIRREPGSTLLTGICIIAFRLYIVFHIFAWYHWQWLGRKAQAQQKDVLWIAFGIFNFITAVMYFLKTYDANGTYNPSWTSLLG